MESNKIIFILVIIAVVLSLISLAAVLWNYKMQTSIAGLYLKEAIKQSESEINRDSFLLFLNETASYNDCINDAVQNLGACLENNLQTCIDDFANTRYNVCENNLNKKISAIRENL